MRHGDVIGVAAVAVDPEKARLGAEVLVAAHADGAASAPDPWINEAHLARTYGSSGLRARRHDLTGRLVPEGQGDLDAPILQRHPAAEAEVVAALPDVEVAVADPRRSDPQENLRACRFGRSDVDGLERRAEIDHPIASHAIPRRVDDPPSFPGAPAFGKTGCERSSRDAPRSECVSGNTAETSLPP